MNASDSAPANHALLIDRAWLFYEASLLYHRKTSGKLRQIVPIFVGTDRHTHALAKWAILRLDELQCRSLDPSRDDHCLNADAGIIADEIKTLSMASAPAHDVSR
ncbi:hypothetical protein [uncultured Thiodictyon sp.]|nr:hypothetical protein [uncultured Thiodictyon sp.]